MSTFTKVIEGKPTITKITRVIETEPTITRVVVEGEPSITKLTRVIESQPSTMQVTRVIEGKGPKILIALKYFISQTETELCDVFQVQVMMLREDYLQVSFSETLESMAVVKNLHASSNISCNKCILLPLTKHHLFVFVG